jgi:hypothetical protein
MKEQAEQLIQLKMSLKEFIHQINHLLEENKKNASSINENAFNRIVDIINDIQTNAQDLHVNVRDEEIKSNTKLIQGFLHQEFYINKANTQKTSLIALKNLQKQPTESFKQMLTLWNSEKKFTQVLFDDLYNIIDELAI